MPVHDKLYQLFLCSVHLGSEVVGLPLGLFTLGDSRGDCPPFTYVSHKLPLLFPVPDHARPCLLLGSTHADTGNR